MLLLPEAEYPKGREPTSLLHWLGIVCETGKLLEGGLLIRPQALISTLRNLDGMLSVISATLRRVLLKLTWMLKTEEI